MSNKQFMDEISNYKAYKELLEKVERLEKERSILITALLDMPYYDQRVKQAFEELGILEQLENEPFVLSNLHRM